VFDAWVMDVERAIEKGLLFFGHGTRLCVMCYHINAYTYHCPLTMYQITTLILDAS
jgi:hypothetical protein